MEACCSYSSTVAPVRSPERRPILSVAAALSRPAISRKVLLSNPVLCTSFLPVIPSPARHRHSRRRSTPIKAVFERFTERAIKAVVFSQREARSLGKDMVFTQHLLLGLIAEDKSHEGFLSSGITIDQARDAVKAIWPGSKAQTNQNQSQSAMASDVSFSVSSKRAFEAALEFSRSMDCNFISPEHIALGLFMVDDGSAIRVLKSLGVDVNELGAVALARIQAELAKDDRSDAYAKANEFKISKQIAQEKRAIVKFGDKKKDKNSAIDQFCEDLTAKASEGKIDPVIGREKEIERMVQIICRRTKNNPILLGDPGVGKTAIAEGLALKIVKTDVPLFLMEKRIMSLDIGLLMAGAKERGELESRVTNLISEVKKSGDVILFIDEVHNLIGSGTVGKGSKGSGLDIGNLLKPALGRGELQVKKYRD